MKTTTQILTDCFKRAGMTGYRAKYLFQLLEVELSKRSEQQRKHFELSGIEDLIVSEDYSLHRGEFTIENGSGSLDYNGDKQYVVKQYMEKPRGYNTLKGALKYIDDNS